MAKPTVLPEFALLDQVDGVSGQNNVITPPTNWKNYGWSYQEKPPRNYMNWIHRHTYNWCKWVDDVMVRGPSIKIAANDAMAFFQEAADYVCDGVNDEVQIQSALTALDAVGGGTLMLSEGTFVIEGPVTGSGLNVFAKTAVIGMGWNTVLQVKTNATSNFYVFHINANEDNVLIRDLAIDGNSAQSSYGHVGIYLENSENSKIVNCHIHGLDDTAGTIKGHGIYIDTNCSHITVSDCYLQSNAQTGIYDYGLYTTISGSRFHSNYGGINIVADYAKVIGNMITNSNTDPGVAINAAAEFVQILDNLIASNERHGLETAGDSCLIEGNLFDNNNLSNSTYSNIKVTSGDYLTITGNTIRKGLYAVYGVDIASSGPLDPLIFGNDCKNAGVTANFNDPGTLAKTLPEYIWNGSTHSQNNLSLANRV